MVLTNEMIYEVLTFYANVNRSREFNIIFYNDFKLKLANILDSLNLSTFDILKVENNNNYYKSLDKIYKNKSNSEISNFFLGYYRRIVNNYKPGFPLFYQIDDVITEYTDLGFNETYLFEHVETDKPSLRIYLHKENFKDGEYLNNMYYDIKKKLEKFTTRTISVYNNSDKNYIMYIR
jgi:hypothetical protein